MRWANILGLKRAGDDLPPAPPAGVLPPPRRDGYTVTQDAALSLSTVFRAVQILTTAAGQLGVKVHRSGALLDAAAVPSIIKTPSLGMSRGDFIEATVTSLALSGNAYWRKRSASGLGVINVELLTPAEVTVLEDLNNPGTPRGYSYRGETLPLDEVHHLKFMHVPGRVHGLGPIQAARSELYGALSVRDYATGWFDNSGVPSGYLKSDQVLTASDAAEAKARFKEAVAGHDMAAFGKGMEYVHLMLSPADAQWLESQQFTTTQLSRLFGTPASLMLAPVQGTSMTYSNVEQDWIAFVRFTLMAYLRKIEDALTALVPRGQTVEFNADSLLRTDTLTRYQAHQIALGKWATVDEIRALEGLPPLTAAQRNELKTQPTAAPAAPASEETPA